MATCANCPNEAFFVYQVTDSYGIDFCSAHVPSFLRSEKYAASLIKLELPVVEETTKASKKKSSDEEPELDDASN